MSDKLDLPYCDGTHHRWTRTRPVHCAGCGQLFTDAEALERETELRKRGLVERKSYWPNVSGISHTGVDRG